MPDTNAYEVICKAGRRSAAMSVRCLQTEIIVVSIQQQPLRLAHLCSEWALSSAMRLTSWLDKRHGVDTDPVSFSRHRRLLSLRKRLACTQQHYAVRLADLASSRSQLTAEKELLARALTMTAHSTDITRMLLSASLPPTSPSSSGYASGFGETRACSPVLHS